MNILLTAVDAGLFDAWTTFCGDAEGVRVHRSSILDVACDAVVSPANSFGFMDGGVDLLYLEHFGRRVQDRVQQAILDHHGGELLVGGAAIVESGDAKIPYLIAAPTMRVPMILPTDSTAAYLAARAVFLLVQRGRFLEGKHAGQPISDHVKTVAFPGLATGVGRMGPATCAHQVRAAIEDVVLSKYAMPRTWAEASERHQLLYTTKLRRLQYERP
jgi:O-acetyl-ADP-ribose deacetylase (regulator of RNase III)